MKKLLLLCLTIMTSACTAKDTNYYLANPKQLQEAINACPAQQPASMNCSELKEVAFKFNKLSNELQAGPQDFGKTILSLQEDIAKKEEILLKGSDEKALIKEQIKQNQQELAERLTIVKLFESPEG